MPRSRTTRTRDTRTRDICAALGFLGTGLGTWWGFQILGYAGRHGPGFFGGLCLALLGAYVGDRVGGGRGGAGGALVPVGIACGFVVVPGLLVHPLLPLAALACLLFGAVGAVSFALRRLRTAKGPG